MKRSLMALAAVALLSAGVGCNRQFVNDGCVTCETGRGSRHCNSCGQGSGLLGKLCQHDAECVNPGPPTAQVAYPYYTVRGPRDYFCDDPPTIGPR